VLNLLLPELQRQAPSKHPISNEPLHLGHSATFDGADQIRQFILIAIFDFREPVSKKLISIV